MKARGNDAHRYSRREVLQSLSGAAVLAAGGSLWSGNGAIAAPSESDLRIAEIRTYIMDDAIFVKVTTDSGQSGWGECDAGSSYVMEAFIHTEHAQHVLGKDPFDNRSTLRPDVLSSAPISGREAPCRTRSAGIDIAIWDLKARILDVPLYRLLGGLYRDRMADLRQLRYGAVGEADQTRRGRAGGQVCARGIPDREVSHADSRRLPESRR